VKAEVAIVGNGVAGTACALRLAWLGASEWADEGGLHVGRDDAGAAVAALVLDEPRRLREARTFVLEGAA